MNHLCPLTTHLFPTFSALLSIIPGSDPAPGWGSVITKAERTRPSAMGCSQRSFWAGLATFSRTDMLPSSGAAQLKAAGPKMEWLAAS